MEIDPKVLPDPENTGGEETPKNQVEQPHVDAQQPDNSQELEALKIKNLELQKQKEHWREKYERDINKPVPSEEILDDGYSDEGRALKNELNTLKEELHSFKKEKQEQLIYIKYPQLKDKQDEFKEFSADPEHSGLSLEKVAKLFLLDKGMLGESILRKGLERPTGGSKSGEFTGISQEDVKRLRETQPRKYIEMLRKGTLKPEDIQ